MNRNAESLEGFEPANMIVVLVRDQDAGQVARSRTMGAKPRREHTGTYAAIDQERGGSRANEKTVA
jgi:hypothetical protein